MITYTVHSEARSQCDWGEPSMIKIVEDVR
jgi:hypothetical protein